jgi:uncharacterized flavoprotein (TIGR03862 family)
MVRDEVAIFGAGPAGLMAAEIVSAAGVPVTVYDAMPTVARKFLLAGKTGLNLTHSESFDRFSMRYGHAIGALRPAIEAFPPEALRQWADGMGAETFTGSSGRVFPKAMKGSPLLRAWIARLKEQGVTIRTRHRWIGFDGTAHRLSTPEGEIHINAKAALLAFGGGSWPRLGSDAAWVEPLAAHGVTIMPLRPANCGFDVGWSPYMVERFAGAPIKSVIATSKAGSMQGEFVISRNGVEGSLIYAHSAALRDQLEKKGAAKLILDLAPGRDEARLAADFRRQAGKISFANRLRKAAGLDAAKSALLRECAPNASSLGPAELAQTVKGLPLHVLRPRPLEEAISSAGGIAWEAMTDHFMLRALPGVFVAGEMIDWEAPTGGYLLNACLATGKAAATGMLQWLAPRTA